jgi:hypothetical protein
MAPRRTPPQTTTATMVPEELGGALDELFAVSRRVISRETLERLGIVILSEEDTQDARGQAAQPSFVVTPEGRRRLESDGYSFANKRAAATHGIWLLDATPPAPPAPPVTEAPAAPAVVEVPVAAPAAPAVTSAPVAAPTAAKPVTKTVIKPAIGDLAKPKVTIRSWQGEESKSFKDSIAAIAEKVLGPYLKRDIEIFVPHGAFSAPLPGPAFNIHIWSSPNCGGPDSRFELPEAMWGLSGFQRDPGHFVSYEQGGTIKTAEGDEVGSFDANNLYLYYDAVHSGSDTDCKIFERFLVESVKIMEHGFRPPNFRDMTQKYVDICSKRVEAQRAQASKKLQELSAQVDNHRQGLIESIREREIQIRILTVHDGLKDDTAAKLATEFNTLRKNYKVESVGFKGDTLIVTTDPLYVQDPRGTKRWHSLGKLTISIDSVRGTIRFKSTKPQTGMQDGMHAPHVYADGHACLGSIDKGMTDLVATYEYSAAVQLAISFLEAVNVDDGAGKYVDRWPEAKIEDIRREEKELEAARKAAQAAEEAEAAEQASSEKKAEKA